MMLTKRRVANELNKMDNKWEVIDFLLKQEDGKLMESLHKILWQCRGIISEPTLVLLQESAHDAVNGD